MRPKFDVLSDGWVPVVDSAGNRMKLGIRDTLSNAHELRAISDVSPLVEYSLYRFLSVFLMDALRPEDFDTIEEYLEEGQFDMAQIDAYIELCRKEGVSFDLFDKSRPFMQARYDAVVDKERKPASTLNCELPNGNNHVHFDHRNPNTVVYAPETAMRQMLTSIVFCTAGAQGYPSNVYASPPFFAIAHGKNLFETIVYTLVPTENISIPFDNPPILWRNNGEITQKKDVAATSWLRGMLFPTRRIILCPTDDGSVREIYFSQGENYTNKDSWRDPFVTYRVLNSGISPLRPHRDIPIWRNLSEIIDVPGGNASHVLAQFQRIHPSEAVPLTLYGVETNQASYLAEMRFDLLLPAGICRDKNHVEWVEACISNAETLAGSLKKSLGNSDAVQKAIIMEAITTFYEETGTEFLALCDKAAECEAKELPALRAAWVKKISKKALAQYDKTISSTNMRGHNLAATAVAEKGLFTAIKKMKEEN